MVGVRALLTTALELAGLAAVTVGALLIYLPAGFLVGGACAVLVGAMLGRGAGR